MREYRGTLTMPGTPSPYRERPIEENLQLFRAMRDGHFADGHCVLRAKIDMASPNMNLRDPTLYRIKRGDHPITGQQWCIYPMYDFAHAISDAMEGITHSLCTLEFADHRPLYDWSIDSVMPSGLLPSFPSPHTHNSDERHRRRRPYQYEFSRLNMQYTVLSKRKLIQLVNEGHVTGWDDPRMPTISGMRRRGYPSAALKLFCERVGISKAENNIDMTVLEDCVREVLDADAPRAFGIEEPLKVTITNWPATAAAAEGKEEEEVFHVARHPKRPELGERDVFFGPTLYIHREDFFDTGLDGKTPPPKGFKRLVPGGQVRLKFAYVITCDEVVRDPATGEVIELKCRYDASTRAGHVGDSGKKVKGIVQWLSAAHVLPAELHVYDRLFTVPSPGSGHADGDFLRDLNPDSKRVLPRALVEESLRDAAVGQTFQFERVGYFAVDKERRTPTGRMVFNRVVTLKDTWATKV